MDDAPAQPDKPKRRRWPWVLLALVLLVAVPLGIIRYRLYRLEVAELAPIRAAGYPVTLAELDAWYPTPRGRNAAEVYQQAFVAYVEDEQLEALLPTFNAELDWPAPDKPIPTEMLAAMETILAQNAAALALLAEAAAIPECRYPIDLTAGIDALMPHWGLLRQGASLLTLQALLQAQDGQHDHSVESVLTLLAARGSVRNEPLLISHLVQIGLLNQGLLAVELILGRASLTDSQLARLSQGFANTIDPTALPRVLAGERALSLGEWDKLRSEVGELGLNGIVTVALRALTGGTGSDRSDRAAYIRIMDEAIKNAADSLGNPADIDAMVRALPYDYIVARDALSRIPIAIQGEQTANAAIQTLLVGLAAKRFQLAHARLPARLDELVPEYLGAMPVDPFDGKPLRYKLTDTGAVVYSVGEDGIDNGGSETNAQGQAYGDGIDIIFTLRR